MAISTTVSTNNGLILSTAVVLLFSNIGRLTAATPVHRPSSCTVCTDADRAKCPVVTPGPDCEVINEPNCGCCKMCAKKAGENCGVGNGYCETGLECVPPPMTPEEYEENGPADYLLDAALGKFICVTRQQICDMLSGLAYDDGNLYLPEFCQNPDSLLPEIPPFLTSDTSDKDDGNDGNIFTPVIAPVEVTQRPVEDTPRPVSPPEAPYPEESEPCFYHFDKVYSKERFDRHEWVPGCEEGGTYYPEQCETTFGLELGRCWCVDSMGIPVTKFIPGEQAHPDICIAIKNNT